MYLVSYKKTLHLVDAFKQQSNCIFFFLTVCTAADWDKVEIVVSEVSETIKWSYSVAVIALIC